MRLTVAAADSSPLCVPPGEEWRQRPRQAAVIRLFSYAFFNKIIMRHDTGMGEAYMDGDYEVSSDFCCRDMDSAAEGLHTAQNTRQGSDRIICGGDSPSLRVRITATCDALYTHWQVDDLGGLLAVACANARNIEASRGLLGFLNTLGGWALRAAHAARSNTISGALFAAMNDDISQSRRRIRSAASVM